jgi:hypothetical protein
MADLLDRLKTALDDRYAVERELGAGGMASYAVNSLCERIGFKSSGRSSFAGVLHARRAA